MERNPGASLMGLGTELDRNTEAIQEKEIRAGPKQRNPDDENQHKIQIQADENERENQLKNERILHKQPVVLLKQISIQKIGITPRQQMKSTEEHVEKNETIQGQFEACAEEAEEEDANDSQNYAGFDKELQELDTDDKEVHRGKFMRKEKNPRFDNIKKDKKQKEYKELHCEKFQRSTIKNTQQKCKRHNTIKMSSEDEEWQPSEEEINMTDDEEYSEKQGSQKNLSITKQITDSRKKYRFEPKHSKKNETIDNMKKNEIQPEQTTSNQSTFLMDVKYRKPKKHQGKKSTKSEDHPPPKK